MKRIINPYAVLDRNRERKMVFYGRVSTEHEAQLAALENQIQRYDDQAKYHPNWTVLDKYIDEGITGTQAKKRPAFLRMIEDAKAGKFDLIVTREVCRFARNTVDTLVTTRELKGIGVEVYFVEDNIWTMDGDGELRLTIMATLAQEESRKVSERVRAGQQISREKGKIYGSGNVLGYDRTGGTYVINPEQAKTVRMIFDMYLKGDIGSTKIAQELTRLGRLNASGNDHWDTCKVTRILKNQTYMGYMAYGKSYTNNYLEQRRHNNHDASTYMLVKTDIPPIVTEAEWNRVQEIIRSRTTKTRPDAPAAKVQPTSGKPICLDLWTNKLRCKCGSGFRRNRWHKNKGKPWSYGYQCYDQINHGSAAKRIEAGADPTGYCDMGMIADWKLDMMGRMILERIWTDRRETIELVCQLLKESSKAETKQQKGNGSAILSAIEKLKAKKSALMEMRTDGEISKEEFTETRRKYEDELKGLETEYEKAKNEHSEKSEGQR